MRCLQRLLWKPALLSSFFVVLLLLFGNTVNAQTKTVSGRITNADTREPIIGATVKVKDGDQVTSTKEDGTFSLPVPANASLEITAVGFNTQIIKANFTQSMGISMAINKTEMGEVVVVGYGTAKKSTLTGSVSTVDSKVFQDRGVVPNPLAALQGQVPGVVVSRSSAAPGQEGWDFQIRGATSVNGGVEPLIVVDGVPMVNTKALNSINPQDIDNISFLKDAAAAIYGSRAAAGVVLITTKRAKTGKPSIQYNGSVTQKRMGLRPSFLNVKDYGNYLYQAISNASTGGVADPNWFWTKMAMLYANRPDTMYIDWQAVNQSVAVTMNGTTYNVSNPATDTKDITFFDTNPIDLLWGEGRALSTQHDISLAARTDKMGYRLSLGYMNDGSMLKWGKNSNNRYNIRFNYDYNFSPRLRVETGVSFEKTDLVYPNRQGEINFGSQPGFPVSTKNGKPYAWGTQNGRNWLLESGGENKGYANRLFLNTKINYKIYKDLSFIVQGGYSWLAIDNQNQFKFIPEIYNYAETFQYPGNPTQANSSYTRQFIKDAYFNTNAYLEYKKTIAQDHNISITGGISYERDEYDSIGTVTRYLASNDVASLGLSLGDNTSRSNYETRNHWALASSFGRVNYGYKDKYLVEAQGRFDGSSRFDANHRKLFYGGVSAGWRISQEKFMENITFLDELKLRGSVGILGSQSSNGIGHYDYIPTVALSAGGPVLGGYTSRSVVAMPFAMLADSNRTWEKVSVKNLALDFSVLNHRLSGSFEYFWKENQNMLWRSTQGYPGVLGVDVPSRNIGVLKIWGWEMSLGWRDRIGKVNYYVNGTLTDNNNKVVSLEGADVITSGQRTLVGYSINSYFGLAYDGRVQADKDVADYTKLLDGNGIGMDASKVIKGINMYKDVNGDGKITDAGASQNKLGKKDANGNPIGDGDVVYLGRSDARYSFAVNMGAEWNGFDFAVVFQGVAKRLIYRRSDWSIPFGTIWQGHADWWVGKTWTPENPNAELPILTTATNNGYGGYGGYNYRISDWSLQNGAYVRLKNIVLGYTLPQSISKKAGIERLRVYVAGNDIWEITKVQDKWDPEQTNNISGGAQRYPFYRMITFGANITF